jgi:dihydrofolate reductase
MIVSLVLAVSDNGVIGRDNQLPWHLPADLKFFKQLTTGHTVIMGRKTYDSIGRPLPNRRNIVVSRKEGFEIPGVEVINSLGGALKACIGEDEVFIIGGATIYAKALDLDIVDRIYLTMVHADFEGDTHFEVPMTKHWLTDHIERHAADEKNPFSYSFVTKTRQREAPLQHATGFGG